jgi:hypothetical protein
MVDARYGFLPWVRRGVVSLAKNAPAQNFVSLQVGLTVNAVPTSPVSVRLHGPGQVVGIDPRAIIRTEPRPDSTSFEPNYFPTVEFATPDFPWLFTPALPDGAALRPWLCLVVVREHDGVALVPRPQALPLLQFSEPAVPVNELPSLDDIAIWAHVQIIGDTLATDAAVRGALAEPSSRLSRLICPRKLEPDTRYLACLVPTYHAGVQAGLSPEDPVDDHDVAPAWNAQTRAPFTLPVYWSWRFGTSAEGDFASLVQKLHPPTKTLRLGLRPMDVSAPGFGMPAFPGLVVDLEGALGSPEVDPRPWPAGTQAQFEQALQPIISPLPGADPIVTPPVYGQVAASVPPPPQESPPSWPKWLRDLNLDPGQRAVAGMGANVVQADQEALMASAWDQFEAVRLANQLLRQIQLARSVGRTTLTRHLAALDSVGTFLQVTRPMHTRLRLDPASTATLGAHLELSRIPSAAVSASFRRLARRNGPIGRRLFPTGAPPSRIVERLNAAPDSASALAVVATRVPPAGTVLLDSVSPQTTLALLTREVVTSARGWGAIATTTTTTTTTTTGTGTATTTTTTTAFGPPASTTAPTPPPSAPAPPPSATAPPTSTVTDGAASTTTVTQWHGNPDAPFWVDHGGSAFPVFVDVPPDATLQQDMQNRFRAAALQVTTYISERTARLVDAPKSPPLASRPADAQARILELLNPDVTLVAEAAARITLPDDDGADPLRPMLNAPEFPQPMSRTLTPQQLLPGVELIEPDTATVLTPNQRFIEAFMVGLNDEMRRELAWRDYPFNQRATFFQHFWDGAGDDIAAIADWDPNHGLGDTMAGDDRVVLLLRGELLRRFPSTIITAVQATQDHGLSTTTLSPIFQGSIEPDIAFFGFPLSVDSALAGPGYYFVIAEHPAEPRFGLEPAAPAGTPASWNDLAWPQVAAAVVGNHLRLTPAPVAPSLPGATWGANSAQQASIHLRQPVRVAMHASALISRGS